MWCREVPQLNKGHQGRDLSAQHVTVQSPGEYPRHYCREKRTERMVQKRDPTAWKRNVQEISYKYSKLVQFDMARGMEPESQFWSSPITLSRVRYPISVGIVPNKRFDLKFLSRSVRDLRGDAPWETTYSSCKLVMFPIHIPIDPERRFDERSSLCKLAAPVKSARNIQFKTWYCAIPALQDRALRR